MDKKEFNSKLVEIWDHLYKIDPTHIRRVSDVYFDTVANDGIELADINACKCNLCQAMHKLFILQLNNNETR